MTPTTTRIDYIGELSEALADNPNNIAIKMHLRSVSAMDDRAFAAHRASMIAAAPQRSQAARSLVLQLVR
ncbi:hypothetical protein EOB77_10620 [Mesorhizobium sp. M7A.F.Ca.MR.228.00.0.0]|nr:hypothetical protein EOB77_10620 [Mesorhizobium sp. M7A.F.Ca.MR.228.00.0.0]